ncbi:hypothetical protein SUGI_0699890 [Cryptomeria japonica]|nr:hypothetical protein SUGI_0699890 [Cryptomeria japonica]
MEILKQLAHDSPARSPIGPQPTHDSLARFPIGPPIGDRPTGSDRDVGPSWAFVAIGGPHHEVECCSARVPSSHIGVGRGFIPVSWYLDKPPGAAQVDFPILGSPHFWFYIVKRSKSSDFVFILHYLLMLIKARVITASICDCLLLIRIKAPES